MVTVPGYRLSGEENVYAVDFRPGSTVKSRVEGEMIISEVTYTGWKVTITTTMIMPIDVAVSYLESLRLPEMARWTHAAATEI
ncbi:MAG TPA: hypothetical protein VHX38_12185 [Pseudonocardiaceae bacterium]|nr:hypothetical protein [Pseudonocardiaceae bacterium]